MPLFRRKGTPWETQESPQPAVRQRPDPYSGWENQSTPPSKPSQSPYSPSVSGNTYAASSRRTEENEVKGESPDEVMRSNTQLLETEDIEDFNDASEEVISIESEDEIIEETAELDYEEDSTEESGEELPETLINTDEISEDYQEESEKITDDIEDKLEDKENTGEIQDKSKKPASTQRKPVNGRLRKLRELREKAGCTQKDMANKLEVSPQFYSQIERGMNVLSTRNAIILAKCFSMSVEELFSDDLLN